MAKLTLADITNIFTAVATLNNNNALIEAAIEKTLSRDGTAPNEMDDDLDMNNHRIYNLPAPVEETEPTRLGDIRAVLDQLDALEDLVEDIEEIISDATAEFEGLVAEAEQAVLDAEDAAAESQSWADASAAAFDLFNDLYLGEKTSLPTLDNDGNPLVNGALVSLTGQVDPLDDAMYVRRNGVWNIISNLTFASEAQAIAGTATNVSMSPLRTAQYVTPQLVPYARKDGVTFTGGVTIGGGNPLILNRLGGPNGGGRLQWEQGSSSTLPGDYVYADTDSNNLRFFATDGSDTRGVLFDLSKLGQGFTDYTNVVTSFFNVKRFGAKGDGVTDDNAAIQAAISAAVTASGGVIYFPAGTYITSNSLTITGTSNCTFLGEGPDRSIITLTNAAAWMFYDAGTSWYRTFSNLGFNASVTMNAGTYFFNFANDKRGLFDRCKMRGYANGIWFAGFEETRMRDVSMAAPSNTGTAVIAGSHGAGITGANLYIDSCFLRGFDDITQNPVTMVGSYGLEIRDCNAVFGINSDWSAYVNGDVLVTPTTSAADHHFTQCFFDSTGEGSCFTAQGAGLKQKFTFTGCWFAGGGNFGSNVNACGLSAEDVGDYADWVITGCRFYSNKGSGIYLGCQSGDFQITGCHFNANGFGSGAGRVGGIFVNPPGVDVYGPSIVGNRTMQGNVGGDLILSANTRGCLVVANYFQNAVSIGGSGHIVDLNRTP